MSSTDQDATLAGGEDERFHTTLIPPEPADRCEERGFPARQNLRVEHLHGSIRPNLDVHRVEVPVDDAEVVRRLEGLGDLSGDCQGIRQRDRSPCASWAGRIYDRVVVRWLRRWLLLSRHARGTLLPVLLLSMLAGTRSHAGADAPALRSRAGVEAPAPRPQRLPVSSQAKPQPQFPPPVASPSASQAPGVLRIRIVLVDADGKTTPAPRHVLLISDNPSTAPPREVATGLDGTADVKLPPGNYTVESDRPVLFGGKAYRWTKTLDVSSGRDVLLELTIANADIESAPAGATTQAFDPAAMLTRWQDSVVVLWTATGRGSGFVVDARGLVATNQRVVGGATAVEVQVTPTVKVAGRVLAAEPGRDVAVIRVDPSAVASVAPVPLGCSAPAATPPAPGQEVFTISVPLWEPKRLTSAGLGRVGPHALESNLVLDTGSAGGPVFAADGSVLGITSVVDGSDEHGSADYRVVRVHDVCAVVASAEKVMAAAPMPSAARLPVEPARLYPPDALERAAKDREASPAPYVASSSEFDVAFLTPVLVYGAQHARRPTSLPSRTNRSREPDYEAEARREALRDFGSWSDYVADYPAVLMLRVTPRLVESFWTKVARGAAQTQGMSLPPMKHFTAGFSSLRAYCGATEVMPIHPFTLQRRVTDTVTIDEGLYVFHPDALTPQCGTVKLVLSSQKAPKGDTLTIDPKLLQQVWQDFAPSRADH